MGTKTSKRNEITISIVDVQNTIDVSSECSSTQSTSCSTKKQNENCSFHLFLLLHSIIDVKLNIIQNDLHN